MSTIISAVMGGINPEPDLGAVAPTAKDQGADFGAMLEAAGAQIERDFDRGLGGKEVAPLRETYLRAVDCSIPSETPDVAPELDGLTGTSTLFGGTDGSQTVNAGESGKAEETEISDHAGKEDASISASPPANEWVSALLWVYPEIAAATESTPEVAPEQAVPLPLSPEIPEAASMASTGEPGVRGKVSPFVADGPDSKLSGSAGAEVPAGAEVMETSGNQPDGRPVPVQPNQAGVFQSVTVAARTAPVKPQVRMGLNGYEASVPLKPAAVSKPLESRMTSGIAIERKAADATASQFGSLEAKLAQATTMSEPLSKTVPPLQQTPASTADPAAGVQGEATAPATGQAGAASAIIAENRGANGETVVLKPDGRPVAPSRIFQSGGAQTPELKTDPDKESGLTETEPLSGLTGDKTISASRTTPDLTTVQNRPALKGRLDRVDGDVQASLQSPLPDAAVPVKDVNVIKESGRPVTQNELFSQIVEHGKIMVSNGHSEIELHLKPDHLGKLKLQISLENQIVTARFVAESEQVKQIIETGLTDLKRALQDSGIQAENLMVATGQSDAGAGGFQQSFSQQSGAASHRNFPQRQSFGSSPELPETPWREARIISQSRVDLIA
jgi:flagellar hook-length control protein FliK